MQLHASKILQDIEDFTDNIKSTIEKTFIGQTPLEQIISKLDSLESNVEEPEDISEPHIGYVHFLK